MAMEILYIVHHNIYVNLTNKCPCSCTFCLRQTRDAMGEGNNLWLEREPSAAEVIEEFKKFPLDEYEEVVFCGFGEPTEALDTLLEVAAFVKANGKNPIRINTNGLGNLIHERNIVPELAKFVDTVSISLNHPDKEKYHALVRSKFKEASYDAMMEFAAECAKVIPYVVMTTVDTTLTKEEERQCAKICEQLGVTYRIRAWED